MYFESTVVSTNTVINKGVVSEYFRQIKEINDGLGIETAPETITSLLRLPDALETEREEFNKEDWEIVYSAIGNAINELNNFRNQEGEALENDILGRINKITSLLTEIEQHEGERIETIKKRINESLSELKTTNGGDENRFEQELIYYLEKLDITEEKVRLTNHLDYFLETINGTEANGRKLGFITQEMGREINTMGSKSNHAQMQKLVVMMKDELEKIKEQVLNVL